MSDNTKEFRGLGGGILYYAFLKELVIWFLHILQVKRAEIKST